MSIGKIIFNAALERGSKLTRKLMAPVTEDIAGAAGGKGLKFSHNLTADTVQLSKTVTKQPLHGINPTMMDHATGKIVVLPRFCTEEMQEARKMNKIAFQQAMTGEVVKTYPKATPKDFERLTSTSFEDSFARVEWTNPKDGKVYNLLKQGETKDGKVIVRILDNEGAFIKDAELVPKKICIIDEFSAETPKTLTDYKHGDKVLIYAKRNNPFATYSTYPASITGDVDADLDNQLKKLLSEIKSGKKADYISMSIGEETDTINTGSKGYFQKLGIIHAAERGTSKFVGSSYVKSAPTSTPKLLDEISQNADARILVSAGNDGAKSISKAFASKNVEGVGSIDPQGKISEFSASRNSIFTQHYEKGEYYQRAVYDKNGNFIGLNITGTTGVDIPCHDLPELAEDIPTVGKNIKEYLLSDNEVAELLDLKKTNKKEFYKKLWKHQENHRIVSREQWNQINTFTTRNGETFTLAYDNTTCPYSSLSDEQFRITDQGTIIPNQLVKVPIIQGTSYSTPVRTAKLALNDMMRGIL